MTDLISEKLLFLNYQATNNTENTLTGLEFEIDYTVKGDCLLSWSHKLKLHANYAYLDSDTNNLFEHSLYARHMVAFYSIFNLVDDYHMTLAYYGNRAITGEAYDG